MNELTLTAVVEGKVLSTNIVDFRDGVKKMLNNLIQVVETDDDFDILSDEVKSLKKFELLTEEAKQNVLSNTGDIEKLIAQLDEAKEEVRQARLKREALLKKRKQEKLDEIKRSALDQIEAPSYVKTTHVLPKVELAMKNKKTFEAIQNSVNELIEEIKGNYAQIKSIIQQHKDNHGTHLIHDENQLYLLEPNIVAMTISERLAKYEAEKLAKKVAEIERQNKEAEQAELRKKIEQEIAPQLPQPSQPIAAPAILKIENQPTQLSSDEEWVQMLESLKIILGQCKPLFEGLKYECNKSRIQAFRETVIAEYRKLL